MSRRQFLRSSGFAAGAVSAPFLTACGTSAPQQVGRELPPGVEISNPFLHGVASGDPRSDRIIFWTRITQNISQEDGFDVSLLLFDDHMASNRIRRIDGLLASPERDFTVKRDVTGLSPATTYYYRFECQLGDEVFLSPIGRTKTTPSANAVAGEGEYDERLRLGMVSCSSLAHGYFNVYRHLAERADLDAIVHLGDYIYEYANGGYEPADGFVGTNNPDYPHRSAGYQPSNEIFELEHYRTRYAQYRLEPELQEAHRQFAWINVWDDHEITNDSYNTGAENHNAGEGDYEQRKDWALQAYREWLPIRDSEHAADANDDAGGERIFRAFNFSPLADLIMLDTRIFGREEQATTMGNLNGDPELLGSEQRNWLQSQLDAATNNNVTWKLLGQQVMVGQLRIADLSAVGGDQLNITINNDQWDGYASARDLLHTMIGGAEEQAGTPANNHDNVVVLTGDIHTSWGFDITRNPGLQVDLAAALTDSNGGILGGLLGALGPVGDILDGAVSGVSDLVNEQVLSQLTAFLNNGNGTYRASDGGDGGNRSLAVEFVTPSVTSPGLEELSTFSGLLSSVNPHMKYAELGQHGYMLLDIDASRIQGEWYYVDTVTDTNSTESFGTLLFANQGDNYLQSAGAMPVPSTARSNPPLLAAEDVII